MLYILFVFWFSLGQSRYNFPLLPPPGTVTEVFKIGETLAGNEEYVIQLKGRFNNRVYAYVNFYYYKSDVFGFTYLPPYYPYCIINYLNVPYFSRIQTVDDYLNKSLGSVPDFSIYYLANYILNFALNFMQSCLRPYPIYCYSFISFGENLAGQLYENLDQFYQKYQFLYNNAPESFSSRVQMILPNFNYFYLYNLSQGYKDLICKKSRVDCKKENDNFYSKPTDLKNYYEYRCYTDPVYVISVRRKLEKKSIRPSVELRYPAEASVSYILQYAPNNFYLANFFNYQRTNYALILGWGTTTKFQNITTGKFVLEEMIKELKARNQKIKPKITRIYAILGGVNCLNYKIFTDVGFRQIAGAEIINPETNKNFCLDAKCVSQGFTESCLDILNNIIFDNYFLLIELNFSNFNFFSPCIFIIFFVFIIF